MVTKQRFYWLPAFLIFSGLTLYFYRQQETLPVVTQSIPVPDPVSTPLKSAPIEETKNEFAAEPAPAKREAQPDTKVLEPCFSFWTQQHRSKFFEKKQFPNKEITLENQRVGNLPKMICNLKVRGEFHSVMLASEPAFEMLLEITEGWLKPSGEELEVYRPDGSPFRKNQVLGFWGALDLDQPTTSVKIKNCGAELGWGLNCPQSR